MRRGTHGKQHWSKELGSISSDSFPFRFSFGVRVALLWASFLLSLLCVQLSVDCATAGKHIRKFIPTRHASVVSCYSSPFLVVSPPKAKKSRSFGKFLLLADDWCGRL